MKIIILDGGLRAARTVDLASPVFKRRLAAIAAVGFSAIVAVVLGAAHWLAPADLALSAEVRALRLKLENQQTELAAARIANQRAIEAYAIRVGELEAHALRLNAFGQRLAEMGNLDPAEFDFENTPGLGGPEAELPTAFAEPALIDWIADLERKVTVSDEQLSALELLIEGRQLASALMPQGRPVTRGWISSNFGMRADPFHGRSAFHAGVDFNGPMGSPVVAVADGIVVYSGWRAGYGNVVDIDHGNGLMTRYGHNQSNLVEEGARVSKGEQIAKMGSSGRATSPHVHFEVIKDGKPVDPRTFVGPRPS